MTRFILLVAILTFVLGIAVRSTAAAPAHAPASGPPIVDRQASTVAQAWAAGATLDVFNPDKSGGIAACVSVISPVAADEGGGETWETGCASLDATSFSLDRRLAWVTLAPISFDLYVSVCDGDSKECSDVYSRTVTVSGSWSASEALVRDRVNAEYPQNDCTVKERGSVHHRAQTTVIAIDGAEFAGEGMVTVADITRTIRCP